MLFKSIFNDHGVREKVNGHLGSEYRLIILIIFSRSQLGLHKGWSPLCQVVEYDLKSIR
jgi:hypothetical protein